MWLVILTFLSMMWARHPFTGTDLAPAILSSKPNGIDVYTIRLYLGDPRFEARFLVDFNSSRLVLSGTPAGNPDQMLVYVASHVFLMDYYVDGSAAAAGGCPECHGVFPMGSGSIIWFVYRQVTLTSASIRFVNYIHESAAISCDAPTPEFCAADGAIYDVPMKIYFTFPEATTYVPPWLFHQYKQKRHATGVWPSLDIDFGDAGTLHIPSHVLFDNPLGEKPRLFIADHPDGSNYTVLGNRVFLAAQFYKSLNSHAVGFINWPVYPNYSLIALLAVAILYTLYFRSNLTPPIYFVSRKLIRAEMLSLVFNMMLEGFVVLAPITVLITGHVLPHLFTPLYFGIILLIAIAFHLFVGCITQLMFWGDGVELLGFMTISNLQSKYSPSTRFGYVRLRVIREMVFETSVLLAVFLIAFSMRQDSYASYLSFITYIWYVANLTYHIFAVALVSTRSPTPAWVLFAGSTLIVNIALWVALLIEICFPAINLFIPRSGIEIAFYLITMHLLFFPVATYCGVLKASNMVEYIYSTVPPLSRAK